MNTENKIKVSIVIVCMNNLKNLYPCLESIRQYTHVSYEILVVAYLFSKENLEKAKTDFTWVQFIESNEIRGFSENNNIALRKARGEYCFVVNDDTKFPMAVVDKLVDSIEKEKRATFMSPVLYFRDGKVQYCGRPPKTKLTYIKELLGLYRESKCKSIYCCGKDVFQTYNICGAAFLIKTNVFRKLGFFDEQFFFCPEDIALSTKANKLGYKAYVDTNIKIYHYHCGTMSMVKSATFPAQIKGELKFFSENSLWKYIAIGLLIYVIMLFKLIILYFLYSFHKNEKYRINIYSKKNVLSTIFSKDSPKQIFEKYYKNIKKS